MAEKEPQRHKSTNGGCPVARLGSKSRCLRVPFPSDPVNPAMWTQIHSSLCRRGKSPSDLWLPPDRLAGRSVFSVDGQFVYFAGDSHATLRFRVFPGYSSGLRPQSTRDSSRRSAADFLAVFVFSMTPWRNSNQQFHPGGIAFPCGSTWGELSSASICARRS